MVTDYDCWHPHQDDVTVDEVVRVLLENADQARHLVRAAVPKLAKRSSSCRVGCHTSLDAALITAPDKRDQGVASKLDTVAGRALKS